jgi:predicted dienelactone hydrolase
MMIARILNATRVIGKRQGYLGLPLRDEKRSTAVDGPETPVMVMVTAWAPTPDELERLAKGASVHLVVVGTQHPPVLLEVGEVHA